MDRPLIVYLIAGEVSGDQLGATLMEELKTQWLGPIKFYGVGGKKMEAQGMKSLFSYHELSLMGFIEILPHIFKISVRINTTVEDILAKKPDVLITIDSPGFCFRVVRKLRKYKLKSRLVHYVAPTVWAYKPGRAKKCARLFDHMLVLLPFEPPYFEKAGLACTWVGHRTAIEVKKGNAGQFREKFKIPDTTTMFCLLPGSRKGELKRHMPVFGKVIAMLSMQYPDLGMVVAVPPNLLPFLKPYFDKCPFLAVVLSDERDRLDAIAASRLAVVKSGTIALEVAMAGTPMVVAYRVNPISAWLFRRISKTKYVNIVNILHGREIIPEMLQEQCTPFLIASAAQYLLSNPDRQRLQKDAAKEALRQLSPHNGQKPSAIAANTVLKVINPDTPDLPPAISLE